MKKYISLGAVLAGSTFMISCDSDDVTVASPAGGTTTNVQPADLGTEAPTNLISLDLGEITAVRGAGFCGFENGGTFLSNTQFSAIGGRGGREVINFDEAVFSGSTITLNNVRVGEADANEAPTQGNLDNVVQPGDLDGVKRTLPTDNDFGSRAYTSADINDLDVDINGSEEVDTLQSAVQKHNGNNRILAHVNGVISGEGTGEEVVVNGTAGEATDGEIRLSADLSEIQLPGGDTFDVAAWNGLGTLNDLDNSFNSGEILDLSGDNFIGLEKLVELVEAYPAVLTGPVKDAFGPALTNLNGVPALVATENGLLRERAESELFEDLRNEFEGVDGVGLKSEGKTVVFTVINAFANDRDFIREVTVTARASFSGAAVESVTSEVEADGNTLEEGDIRVVTSTELIELEEVSGVSQIQNDAGFQNFGNFTAN